MLNASKYMLNLNAVKKPERSTLVNTALVSGIIGGMAAVAEANKCLSQYLAPEQSKTEMGLDCAQCEK